MAKTVIQIPRSMTFAFKGAYDFSRPLRVFNWDLRDQEVEIDMSRCQNANYQTISLIVLYAWHLRSQGCQVNYKLGSLRFGASKMWHMMGARESQQVLCGNNRNFRSHFYKPLFAIRNNHDFRAALRKAESYTQGFDVEYEKTLRYVLSEVLYNTLEHGHNIDIPSLTQFTWYRDRGELSVIVADLGMGIRQHLRQAYPEIEDDISAIRHALRPQVSGTFFQSQPYEAKNNAGVGLYISSNIIRKLHADMHIISGNGVVHISPSDITDRKINTSWPGTFVYLTIKLGSSKGINLQRMMSEFRAAATSELEKASQIEQKEKFYLSISNYFNRYAEDKVAAIRVRDRYILPAISAEKTLVIDFEDVIAAPHSFLNALFATPIQRLGMSAYKRIKVINAAPEIRETIDFIMDENTTPSRN